MPVFDVTHIVSHSESVWDRGDYRSKNIKAMVDWLTENVGDFYGHGDDYTRSDNEKQGTSVLYIGSGWQMEQDWKGDPNGYVELWWQVDITDEQKATLFALKWMR